MRPRRSEQPSDEVIKVRVSREEKDRIREAARANRQNLSDFARDGMLTAASDTLEDPIESDSDSDSE